MPPTIDPADFSPQALQAVQEEGYFRGCVVTMMEANQREHAAILTATEKMHSACLAQRLTAEAESFARLGAVEKELARLQGQQSLAAENGLVAAVAKATTAAQSPVPRKGTDWVRFGKVCAMLAVVVFAAIAGLRVLTQPSEDVIIAKVVAAMQKGKTP